MEDKLSEFDQVNEQFLPMLSDMTSYTIYFLNKSVKPLQKYFPFHSSPRKFTNNTDCLNKLRKTYIR